MRGPNTLISSLPKTPQARRVHREWTRRACYDSSRSPRSLAGTFGCEPVLRASSSRPGPAPVHSAGDRGGTRSSDGRWIATAHRDRSTTAPIKAVTRLDGRGMRSSSEVLVRPTCDRGVPRPCSNRSRCRAGMRPITTLAATDRSPVRHRMPRSPDPSAPRIACRLRPSVLPSLRRRGANIVVGHRAHSLVSWRQIDSPSVQSCDRANRRLDASYHDAGERVPRSPWAPVARCFIGAARVRCPGRRVTLSPRPRRSARPRRSRCTARLRAQHT